jgi:3D (Asp-Asp-Asp) domain-containing protein
MEGPNHYFRAWGGMRRLSALEILFSMFCLVFILAYENSTISESSVENSSMAPLESQGIFKTSRVTELPRVPTERPQTNTTKALFTAYTPSPEETDADPFIMASGKRVYRGAVACPIWFELGEKIKVEGFGVLTCEDRMAKRYRNKERFDILMFSKKRALQFGVKELPYTSL